jgi:Holliday junction resolvase RusA-like endonuclease
MAESVTIILPLPPKALSPNCTVATPGGRFTKATATRRYRRLAKEAVEAENIETVPWKKVTVKATFFWKHKRRRDPDNANSSLKAAYDGIVDAGLVADDDYEHMVRLPPCFTYDHYCPRVVLTIMRCK